MNQTGTILKHGHTVYGRKTSLYQVWDNMLQRTSPLNKHTKKYYADRNITVCKDWHDASVFIEWAELHGYEKGLQLDRINNDGNYCPENCRFVTYAENMKNRRISKDFGIYWQRGAFIIQITRGKVAHYGGRTKDINEARKLREELIDELKIMYEIVI